MRTVIVRDAMRIPLGKQGENNAVLVVWPGIVEKYAKLYGKGRFELVVVQKGKAYPAVVSVTGADLVWAVRAADVATAEVGSLELIYYVGDTIAKSQTWETVVIASKSADGMTEPPEDPARAWFDAIKRQIGDLNKLTTKAKENLVAAINEAARTGSGGGGTVEMRVDGGYIQYSTDGVTWENLIAVASLEGKPGKDGEPGAPGDPGKDGEPGKDGHTPKIAATKTGKTTSITADGVEIAQIKDGEDAASDLSLGITGATVGQIAKITAVDETGKPTKWEPVDMASGGGGETWELIASGEMQETATLYINKDNNGLPFSLKSAQIFVRGDISITKPSCMRISAERYGSPKDYDAYSIEVYFGKENPKVNLWYVLREKTMPMLFCEVAGINWQSADCQVLMGVHRHYTATEDVYGKDPLNHLINQVVIGPHMGDGNMAAGCKWEIWGVRA